MEGTRSESRRAEGTMHSTVSCPHCGVQLRSGKSLPAGAKLRCPSCLQQIQLTPAVPMLEAEVIPPPPPSAPPTRIAPAVIIASSVMGLLAVAVLAAVTFQPRTEPQPVARESERDRSDDSERRALAELTQKLDAQTKALEAQRKALALTQQLAKAAKALEEKKYAEAEQAFAAARKLAPESEEAEKGLIDAKAAQVIAKVVGDDQDKRRDKVQKLLTDGKTSLRDKKYALAITVLESARALDPADKEVLDALAEARQLLDANENDKKALAAFQQHMVAGKAALTAERFGDALNEYAAALRLMPEDLEAKHGKQIAENKIVGVADRQKRQAAFEALALRGNGALKQRRFTEAVESLKSANKLNPDDKDVQRDLRQAEQGLKDVKAKNPSLRLRAEEAMNARRFEEARTLADEARKNWPEDSKAEKLYQNADRAAENLRTANDAYLRYVQQASLAYSQANYAAAVTAYAEALRLMPTDLETERQLARARAALARELRNQQDAKRAFDAGSAALNRKSWDEAITQFNQALKLAPNDPQAEEGLSRARYGKAMKTGMAALQARPPRKQEAIQSFEAALSEKKGDFVATDSLRRARALR